MPFERLADNAYRHQMMGVQYQKVDIVACNTTYVNACRILLFKKMLFFTFHCAINTDRFPGIDPAMTEKRWWLGSTAAAAAQLTTANLKTTIRGSQSQEHLRSSKETIKLIEEHTGAVSPLLLVGCYSIGIQRWYKAVGGCIAAMPHKRNRSVIKRRQPTNTATIRVRRKKNFFTLFWVFSFYLIN